MPNHVKNILSFDVQGDELQAILERIKNDEIGVGSIDFREIIPMPERLSIVPGFPYGEIISFYLTATNPKLPYLGVEKLSDEAFKEICSNVKNILADEKINSYLTKDQIKKTANRFRDYLAANDAPYEDFKSYMMQTGKYFADNIDHMIPVACQDFRHKEWNTKWDAFNFYEYDGGQSITFFTAWNPPIPIIKKLSEWYPDIPILHQWADEDFGFNVGEVEYYKNEKSMEKDPANESKEAFEMSAAIWDIDLLEYGYRISDDGSTYVFDENSSENRITPHDFIDEIKPDGKENISDEESQEETGGMNLCL